MDVPNRIVRVAGWVVIACGIASCSTGGIKMYEGPDQESTSLVYARIYGPGSILKEVDGKKVWSSSLTTEPIFVALEPGHHSFLLLTIADSYWSQSGSGFRSATASIDVETTAGHSYLFRAVRVDADHVRFEYRDKGSGYNPACFEAKNWPERVELLFLPSSDVQGC